MSTNNSLWQYNYTKIAHSQWILIPLFLLLFALEARTYTTYYKVSITERIILLILIIAIILITKRRSTNLFNVKQLLVALILTTSLLLNKILTSDLSSFSVLLVFQIFIAFIFVQLLSYEDFVKTYTNSMIILCAYSVLCTYLVITFSTYFNSILPSFIHAGKDMYFLDAGLTNIYIPMYGMQFRNYGLFTEPGVYQFYINLALIFELWKRNSEKYKVLRILILVITLITTFSTTGIIVGLLIVCAFIIQNSNNKKGKIKIKLLLTILILSSICMYYFIPEFKDLINQSIGKFSGGESFNSRSGSLWGNLYAWLEKPFIGWGYEAGVNEAGTRFLSLYTEDNTNTIFTNLAFFGLVYGSFYLMLFTKFTFKISSNMLTKLLLFIGLMLSINSQRFIDSTIVFILIFYSVNKMEKKEKIYELQR